MNLFKRYLSRQHHRVKARERSSTLPGRRLVKSRLFLVERLSQDLAPRGIRIPDVQRGVVLRKLFHQAKRLPILGLRSQRERVVMRADQMDHQRDLRSGLKDRLKGVPGVRSVCQARGLRRRILFGFRIAGHKRRLSPGSGGTYRRTVDSETICRRV